MTTRLIHVTTQYSSTYRTPQYSYLNVVIRQVGNTTVKIVEPLHVALLGKKVETSYINSRYIQYAVMVESSSATGKHTFSTHYSN